MPIRSELFSIERLEQHAESLATAQRVTEKSAAGRPLTARLGENGRVLLHAYRTIAEAISEKQVIMPAAEWLVDNYHVVDEQIREIHDDLPLGYYRQLPKLAEGPLEGYPRVYGIAWAFVAATTDLSTGKVWSTLPKALINYFSLLANCEIIHNSQNGFCKNENRYGVNT